MARLSAFSHDARMLGDDIPDVESLRKRYLYLPLRMLFRKSAVCKILTASNDEDGVALSGIR